MLLRRKLIIETPMYEYDVTLEQQNRETEPRHYIRGPYMQYETKNKNNRKYLKEEMIKDVERFDKEMIQSNRAGGELGHCVKNSYKILTSDGWKQLKDIADDEQVYTLNIQTNKKEIEIISKKILNNYEGKMIRIKGKKIDALFTTNHRVLVGDSSGNIDYMYAEDLYDDNKTLKEILVMKGESFELSKIDSITEEYYNGEIGCVETPKNHNWYCMDDDGNEFWTGNSSNPEIDLSKLCHRILSLEHDESSKHFIGKSMILSTPSGKIMESLLKDGVKTGMSTKALGQIEESSDCNLVKQFFLIGVDCVYDPSYSSAFVNGILESKEFILGSNNKFEEAYDKFESGLAKYPSKYKDQINAHIKLQVESFLRSLKK